MTMKINVNFKINFKKSPLETKMIFPQNNSKLSYKYFSFFFNIVMEYSTYKLLEWLKNALKAL